jgi:hypothetical protein
MDEVRQVDAPDLRSRPTAPLQIEALPHIARQLYDGVHRICQVETQQQRETEMRARQAEEALSEALHAIQDTRAEQWTMISNVTQPASELLQAVVHLLQLLPSKNE